MRATVAYVIATAMITCFVSTVTAKESGKPHTPPTGLHMKLNGACDFVGCNERFSNDMGDTITISGCDPATATKTEQTWTRQDDGSYTVTKRSQEQLESCPPSD